MDYDFVKKIIKERFSLGDGFSSFEKNLEIIVPEYSFLEVEERSIYKISKDLYPYIDDGYKVLSAIKSFVRNFNITFEDYSNNKILYKGNTVKIFKLAVDYYSEDLREAFGSLCISEREVCYRLCEKISYINNIKYNELFHLINKLYKPSEIKIIKESFLFEEKNNFEKFSSFLLKKIFEKIGCFKINYSKDLYFVISRNFNDYFLCSSGEGWTSCLNPESSSGFWSSLPFLTSDRNRCLCFISNLETKEYLGVKSFRMFKRGWGELDANNIINTGMFYPAKEYLEDTFFKKMNLEGKMKNISNDFFSKYPLDIFYNKYNSFDFLYQDDTHFYISDDQIFLKKGIRNHSILIKDFGIRDYHLCSYKNGLKNLICDNQEISDFPGVHFCEECYGLVDENSKISYNLIDGKAKKTCKQCFRKYVGKGLIRCSHCKTILNSAFHFGNSNAKGSIILCSTCYACERCGELFVLKDDIYLCEKCKIKKFRVNEDDYEDDYEDERENEEYE